MWTIKTAIKIGALLTLIPVLIYFVFNREKPEVKLSEQQLSDIEFTYINNNLDLIDILRKNVNKKNISLRNCSGSLVDDDKDGYFDNTSILFKNQIMSDREKRLTVLYDFCSFETTKGDPIDFMIYTDRLAKDFIYTDNNNVKYIPILSIKTTDSKHIEKKGYLSEEALTSYFD